jgi:hypothetical protein
VSAIRAGDKHEQARHILRKGRNHGVVRTDRVRLQSSCASGKNHPFHAGPDAAMLQKIKEALAVRGESGVLCDATTELVSEMGVARRSAGAC